MPESIRGVGTTGSVSGAAAGRSRTTKSVDSASSAATSTGGGGVDFANVAQTEALLQTIVDAASNVPGIDHARVSELQQAISSGVYQSNPKAIAEKFAELENMLAAAGINR
jgi:flagellar biosynthesis anti-sigma factor FlgM